MITVFTFDMVASNMTDCIQMSCHTITIQRLKEGDLPTGILLDLLSINRNSTDRVQTVRAYVHSDSMEAHNANLNSTKTCIVVCWSSSSDMFFE